MRYVPPQKSSSSTVPAARPKMAVRLPMNVMVLTVVTDFLRVNLRSSSQKLMSGWMMEIALVMPAKNRYGR